MVLRLLVLPLKEQLQSGHAVSAKE